MSDSSKDGYTLTLAQILGLPTSPDFPKLEPGDLVKKIDSDPGDAHQNGTQAIVVGAAVRSDGVALVYYVIWSGDSRWCVAAANKLELIARGVISVPANVLRHVAELTDSAMLFAEPIDNS